MRRAMTTPLTVPARPRPSGRSRGSPPRTCASSASTTGSRTASSTAPGRPPVSSQLGPARRDGHDGHDLTGDTGFDSYSTIRNGGATTQTAYAVNAGRLCEVSLLNGQFTDLGSFGDSTPAVTDLAIAMNQR